MCLKRTISQNSINETFIFWQNWNLHRNQKWKKKLDNMVFTFTSYNHYDIDLQLNFERILFSKISYKALVSS